MILRSISIVGVFSISLGGAMAESIGQLGPYNVEVIENNDGDEILKVGDVEILTNAIINIEAITSVEGIPVIVGASSIGGNACNAQSFIVALVKDETVFFEAPTCMMNTISVENDRIIISTEPMPTRAAETWVWTPQNGLVEADPQAFEYDPNLGWDQLAAQSPHHPYDLFNILPIKTAIEERLESVPETERERFYESIMALGNGEMQGTTFYGYSCIKHTCEADRAMIFADVTTQSVYLAWRGADGSRIRAPQQSEWPASAANAFSNWLEQP